MVFPSFYFGPALYFKLLKDTPSPSIDTAEHFVKQTYRNRLSLYSANGLLSLSIPLKKWRNHTPIKEIEIAYTEDWQTQHWRSLCAAYSRSPFFEYYDLEFEQLYSQKFESLLEWNAACFKTILKVTNLNLNYTYSDQFDITQNIDSNLVSTKTNEVLNQYQFPFYLQTFNEKHGFIPNLSIIDLVFNLGGETIAYLNSITQK